MKKLLMALLITAIAASQAWAGKTDIDIGKLGQAYFKELSHELGSAMTYKPVSPAEPLGIIGLDVGIEMTFADIEEDSAFWAAASSDMPGMLPIPKLHVRKGLPLGIDIGAVYAKVPGSDIQLIGAELKYAILEGGIASPAVAVRGTYTALDGVTGLDMNSMGVDLSVSKGFALLTPYAGIGQVKIESDPLGGLSKESFTETKFFGGVQISLLLFKITAEYEQAEIPSYTLKISMGL